MIPLNHPYFLGTLIIFISLVFTFIYHLNTKKSIDKLNYEINYLRLEVEDKQNRISRLESNLQDISAQEHHNIVELIESSIWTLNNNIDRLVEECQK